MGACTSHTHTRSRVTCCTQVTGWEEGGNALGSPHPEPSREAPRCELWMRAHPHPPTRAQRVQGACPAPMHLCPLNPGAQAHASKGRAPREALGASTGGRSREPRPVPERLPRCGRLTAES